MSDTQKKKCPGLLEQDGAECAQSNQHDEIITPNRQAVKPRANWLREFHVRSGLKSAEIIELIRPLCPGFDKTLLAKCENPDRYGIQISQKVIKHLKGWEKEHEKEEQP